MESVILSIMLGFSSPADTNVNIENVGALSVEDRDRLGTSGKGKKRRISNNNDLTVLKTTSKKGKKRRL